MLAARGAPLEVSRVLVEHQRFVGLPQPLRPQELGCAGAAAVVAMLQHLAGCVVLTTEGDGMGTEPRLWLRDRPPPSFAKPPGFDIVRGDWRCGCGNYNFSKRFECNHCHGPRPQPKAPPLPPPPQPPSRPSWPPQAWQPQAQPPPAPPPQWRGAAPPPQFASGPPPVRCAYCGGSDTLRPALRIIYTHVRPHRRAMTNGAASMVFTPEGLTTKGRRNL